MFGSSGVLFLELLELFGGAGLSHCVVDQLDNVRRLDILIPITLGDCEALEVQLGCTLALLLGPHLICTFIVIREAAVLLDDFLKFRALRFAVLALADCS